MSSRIQILEVTFRCLFKSSNYQHIGQLDARETLTGAVCGPSAWFGPSCRLVSPSLSSGQLWGLPSRLAVAGEVAEVGLHHPPSAPTCRQF
jgi:hypothetical protein